MSGVKKQPSSAGKPAAKAPVQSHNIMSFFGKPKATAAPAPASSTAAAAPPAAAAAATPSAAAPVRTVFTPASSFAAPPSAAGGASAVAASYFGGASAAPLPSRAAAAAAAGAPVPPSSLPVHTPVKPAAKPSMSLAAPSSATSATASPASSSASPSSYSLSAGGRKRKSVSYHEDGHEDEDDDEDTPVKAPLSAAAKKAKKRIADDDDEEYGDSGVKSESEDDFVDDASDDEPSSSSKGGSAKKAAGASSSAKKPVARTTSVDDEEGAARGGKDYSTPFLDPSVRTDLNRRRPGEPGYDPSTLYIAPQYMAKFTPAEKQYWEIKQQNMDLVLFFKIGKFYELFDEDAETGVRELGLSYMVNQKRPHCGFPEAGLAKYAERLVHLGYRIGQVDQTETPEMLKIANAEGKKKGIKARSAVNREISQVLTPGTIVDSDVLKSDYSNFLFALVERELTHDEIEQQRAEQQRAHEEVHGTDGAGLAEDTNVFVVEYGFSYVDCTTGRFFVGQHRDDKQRSFLKTLLGFVAPKEILLPRGKLSADTQNTLRYELRDDTTRIELEEGKEFWSAEKTVQIINTKKYFAGVKKEESDAAASSSSSSSSSSGRWPSALQKLVDEKQTLTLHSFGGLLFYLQRTMHDMELLSLGNISSHFVPNESEFSKCLSLDGQTLTNLEIVRAQDGSTKGTLLEFVNRAVTAFGKRKLREWVTRPLFAVSAIKQRQDAVEFFMEQVDLADSLRKSLKALPDLERFLSRIHANGLKKAMNVVMYENVDAKKLDVFLKTLEGFDQCNRILKQFDSVDLEQEGLVSGSRLRALLTQQVKGGLLPDFMPALQRIRSSFDPRLAASTHKIKPNPGLVADYDQCVNQLDDLRGQCDKYLSELRRQFNDSSIKFMHKGKERYQIEIPIKSLSKGIPSGFDLMSSSKTVKRYWTSRSRKLSEEITELELEVEQHEKDMSRTIFHTFAEDYQLWIGAVEVVAELDCLLSLALVSKHHQSCVRPEFVAFEENNCQSKLNLRQAFHPCLYEAETKNAMNGSTTFIANDTVIGCEENPARFVLVSGPNMGGKSTLLRQTCCAVILAQLGCWVPAERMELTPIDRIFTRVGANDRIMQGQSTFLVELMETSVILKNATNRSLVILDELGRGTSTFDGTAIAHAVIEHLSQNVDCLTLFASHYHVLFSDFADDPRISMYHMACQVNEDAGDSDVTFLYRFVPGVCPKSYGNNVARAAGLPDSVIERAKLMSANFERRCVEAMGNSRTTLMQAFPQQKPSSSTLLLPLSTIESILADLNLDGDSAPSDEALERLIDIKERFEATEEMYSKKKQQQQQQQASMTDVQ